MDNELKFDYCTPKKVKIIVEKVTQHPVSGVCHCHKEGEEYSFDFERCPADFCAAAFHSLWPHLRVIELRGRHPWDCKEGETRVSCPDPDKPVVFRIVGE